METPPLTEWEARERDGLLALETPEWREKRLEAENSNTLSKTLARHAEAIIAAWTEDPTVSKMQGHLLVEAIATHAQTPSDTLIKLLNLSTYFFNLGKPNQDGFGPAHRWVIDTQSILELAVPACARGIRSNPTTFTFWKNADPIACEQQLREEDLSLSVATQLTQHPLKSVAQSAHFHISLAGEIQNRNEGLKILAENKSEIQISGDLPEYLAVSSLKWALESNFYNEGQSPFWGERAYSALKMSIVDSPFVFGSWNRSPLQLINHLARDGNRFVRWAAQTRLADPDFVFTWHDE